jgi:hypothetical protein
MNQENQIEIPQSFVAIFMAPGKTKPSVPWLEVMKRYELCEDMANILTHTAGDLVLDYGVCDIEILDRCYAGLQNSSDAVTPSEARWIIMRLAELMGWELPIDRYPDPGTQPVSSSAGLVTA